MKHLLAIIFILLLSSGLAYSQKGQEKTYPIVIKFISYGSGIPDSKLIVDFINSFEKKNKVKEIKIDTIGRLGREGEYNLGLCLQDLTKKQKKSFITGLKKIHKMPGQPGEIQYEENVVVNADKNPSRGQLETIKIN